MGTIQRVDDYEELQGQPGYLLVENKSLTDSVNLPILDVSAQEIVGALEAALEQFCKILGDKKRYC